MGPPRSLPSLQEQDLIDDDNESVKLGFGTMPDPRVSAGTEAEATVTITDDDTADIVLSATSLTLTEGDVSGDSYTVQPGHRAHGRGDRHRHRASRRPT